MHILVRGGDKQIPLLARNNHQTEPAFNFILSGSLSFKSNGDIQMKPLGNLITYDGECERCGKRCYLTYEHAKRAIQCTKRTMGGRSIAGVGVYYCKHSSSWHIGKSDVKKINKNHSNVRQWRRQEAMSYLRQY